MNNIIFDMLSSPAPRRIVIDSDTYNEADDQFAIGYAATSKNISLDAVLIAPYTHGLEGFPAEGCRLSYDEAVRVLKHAGREDVPVIMGALDFMPDKNTPVDSPAARYMIDTAMALPEGERLTVVAIGAGTNIASALLMEPRLKDKLILLWQVGHDHECIEGGEYNMCGDINAAYAIFESEVPLLQLPAYGGASSLRVNMWELHERILGKNPLCDFLYDCLYRYTRCNDETVLREVHKIIWDIGLIAVVSVGEGQFSLMERPGLLPDGKYTKGTGRGLYLCAVAELPYDAVFEDMYASVTEAAR